MNDWGKGWANQWVKLFWRKVKKGPIGLEGPNITTKLAVSFKKWSNWAKRYKRQDFVISMEVKQGQKEQMLLDLRVVYLIFDVETKKDNVSKESQKEQK